MGGVEIKRGRLVRLGNHRSLAQQTAGRGPRNPTAKGGFKLGRFLPRGALMKWGGIPFGEEIGGQAALGGLTGKVGFLGGGGVLGGF